MIGLPTETDDDLVAIRDLTLQTARADAELTRGRRAQVGRIVGSVNPLVPKPGTAYQWLPMEDPASVERKIKRLRSLTADIDNVFFNIKSERHSYYQALLSLGDRRVAPAIEIAERNGQNSARRRRRGRDRRRFLHLSRPQPGCLPAVGCHRRRHEAPVLRGRVSPNPSAKSGRSLPSAQENAKLLPVIHISRQL